MKYTRARVTNNTQREHLCTCTRLPASVNCPFVGTVLTLCFNEERRWWGGGAFTFMDPRRVHRCSVLLHKAIRGPHCPPDYDFPSTRMTTDSNRLAVCCMFAMMSLNKPQWETLMKWSATNYKLRGQLGKNTSTEGGMMETPLSPLKTLFMDCLPKQMRFHDEVKVAMWK